MQTAPSAEIELTLSGLFTATTGPDTRLPLTHALQLGLQMARVVAQAHDEGRVLGQLNASGLRFAANGALALGTLRGPPLAPELVDGEAPDRLSDVYALGALVYRLLTGRDVSAQGFAEPPSHFNPAVDSELDELVLSSLDDDPSERPISGRHFERGLMRVFEELDLEPTDAGLTQMLSEVKRKVSPKAAPKAKPVAARAVAARPAVVKAPAPRARLEAVERSFDDDEPIDNRPAWLRDPTQRTWAMRGGIALAVVCALLMFWPSAKKKKKVAPQAEDTSVSVKARSSPRIITPSVSPVQAVPVTEVPVKSARR